MISLLFAALVAAADAGTQTIPIATLDSAPDIVPLVPPPAEYTLSFRDTEAAGRSTTEDRGSAPGRAEAAGRSTNDWRVQVNPRPGEPQPGAVVELRFDVGRHGDSEAGEPQPYSDAKLALTVTGPGPKLRYLVRPLGDAGAYGVHWTPSGRGLWTLALAPCWTSSACAASIAFAYAVDPLLWTQLIVDTRFELAFSVPSGFRKSLESGTSS